MSNFIPTISLPRPSGLSDVRGIVQYLGDLNKQLLTRLFPLVARSNNSLQKDGSEAMAAPIVLATYTTATLPTASSWTGGLVYVSDAAAGSKLQYSDGSSWIAAG